MLHILFGTLEGEDEGKEMPFIQVVDNYFNDYYKPEWLTNDLAKQIIKDIDKSDVVGPNLIQSPVLGLIPPSTLSTGTKAVLLMQNLDGCRIWATCAGDNCAKWILKVAETKEVHIYLAHMMDFDEEVCGPLTAHIENTDTVVHSDLEYFLEFEKYRATHDCEWY